MVLNLPTKNQQSICIHASPPCVLYSEMALIHNAEVGMKTLSEAKSYDTQIIVLLTYQHC